MGYLYRPKLKTSDAPGDGKGPGHFVDVKASPSFQRLTTSLRYLVLIPGLSRAASEGPLPRSIVVVPCGTGGSICRAQPA